MDALILVDIQNDFLPGGALAVPHGDDVIAVANTLMPRFDLVIATKDWHPADHGSFAANHAGARVGVTIELADLPQILWPVHCVQNTHGAELAAALHRDRIDRVVCKGMDRDVDSYSGFFDNGRRKATVLAENLKSKGASRVFLMGLATDYCVKFTALDAVSLGFDTTLVLDGCRGVELQTGDCERAVAAMKAAGVSIVMSDSLTASRVS